MSKLLENISDLNDLILQGRALEAFEKYYHDDVVMQENDHPPVLGKEANRKREVEFFGSITELRSAKPIQVAIGEGVTMVKWYFDYTHKDWGERKYTQFTVQEWENAQIIKEQFFYGN